MPARTRAHCYVCTCAHAYGRGHMSPVLTISKIQVGQASTFVRCNTLACPSGVLREEVGSSCAAPGDESGARCAGDAAHDPEHSVGAVRGGGG